MSGPVVLTAEHRYRHTRKHWDHLPAAQWCSLAYPIPHWQRAMIGALPKLGEDAAKPATFAYVNHGRWLVDCPFCGSTQIAAKSDRRFLCAGADGCANAQVGGAYIPVVWPKDADRIEAELLQRPTPNNRNWMPGETVKDLRRENAEHGVARGGDA